MTPEQIKAARAAVSSLRCRGFAKRAPLTASELLSILDDILAGLEKEAAKALNTGEGKPK